MSNYRELDEAIIQAITGSPGVKMNPLIELVVNHVLPHVTDRKCSMRVVDARLQSLRKKQKIHYDSGWYMRRTPA